jgi:hypothetical protein
MFVETLAAMALMSGGGQEAGARAAPRGDYRDSCSGAYTNRGRLYADCRARNGQVRETSIELNRCSDYEIRNDNGLLVCGPNRGDYEDGNGGGGGGGGGWDPTRPPSGDYQRSCVNPQVSRGRLSASCSTRNNQFRRSSIELSRCGRDEVRNDNGLLVCGSWRGEFDDEGGGGGGGGWDPTRPPSGDYQNSCSRTEVRRGRLYADCRTRGSQTRRSSIEVNRCRNDEIRNDNGLLVCGSWRGQFEDEGGGGGGGWGRQSITVYQDSNYRGASTRFDGEVANLGSSGFNDQISSVQVQGEWEACTDAYFRGRCQTFTGDVRNLTIMGMNDSISSLRPSRRGW